MPKKRRKPEEIVAIEFAAFSTRLGPEVRRARLDDLTRHRAAPDIGIGAHSLAGSLGPADAFDHIFPGRGSQEQDEAIVTERCGGGTDRLPNDRQALRALDADSDRAASFGCTVTSRRPLSGTRRPRACPGYCRREDHLR